MQHKDSDLQSHLGLVAFVASGALVGSVVRVGPHVLTHVTNGFVQLSTLATLVPPLTHMDFHVFFQQVASQKLLLAQCAFKGLVTCNKTKQTHKPKK